MHVLVVEDEDAIAVPLTEGLTREGFTVTRVATGQAALDAPVPDVVLLDLRLPDIDGYEVCRRIRARSDVPIIVVTAKGEEVDRVVGLELGADDYVVKPFGLRELVARIRAVSRRAGRQSFESELLQVDELTVDLRARRASVDGREVQLTLKEFDLLALLMRDAGAVVTKQRILNEVWNTSWYGATKTVDVHVASLRKKLGDPGPDRDRPRRRPSLSQRPVTRRLLLSYVVLTLGVLIALELPLGILNAHNLRQDLRSKVQRDAVTLGSLAEDALEHRRPADANVRAAVSALRGGDRRACRRARRVGSSRRRLGRCEDDDAEPVRGLLVTMPVAANGRVFGTVAISYPTSSTDRRIVRDWFGLAIAAAVVLGAAAVLGLLLSRSVSRPLRRVERAAQRIGDGELDARAPESDGPDDVRRLARTLNETAAKLETLVRSQEDFVADASHQLRTPLTALRLRLENLERDVAPTGRETLAAALTEADRLSRLVSELLALARPQDQVEPADAIDVTAVAAARAEAWDALAAERDLRIDTVWRTGPRAGRSRTDRAGARQPARERGRGLSSREHDPPELRTTRRLDRAARRRRRPGPLGRRARARLRPLLARRLGRRFGPRPRDRAAARRGRRRRNRAPRSIRRRRRRRCPPASGRLSPA